MNAFKLNGKVGYLARRAIIEGLGIFSSDIYKEVKDITYKGVIITKDGKKYKLKLEEI